MFQNIGSNKRDTPTINVVGQLSDLMLRRAIFHKYIDPGSPLLDVLIDGILVPYTLIDIGVSINVVIK